MAQMTEVLWGLVHVAGGLVMGKVFCHAFLYWQTGMTLKEWKVHWVVKALSRQGR